jgi:hypothetical protein
MNLDHNIDSIMWNVSRNEGGKFKSYLVLSLSL